MLRADLMGGHRGPDRQKKHRERREMEPHFYPCLLLCRSRVPQDSQAKLEPLAFLVPKQRR